MVHKKETGNRDESQPVAGGTVMPQISESSIHANELEVSAIIERFNGILVQNSSANTATSVVNNQVRSSNNAGANCNNCNQPHPMHKCIRFLALTLEQRRNRTYGLQLCFNCFSPNHRAGSQSCKSGPCRNCPGNERHNSLLCRRAIENAISRNKASANIQQTSLQRTLDAAAALHVPSTSNINEQGAIVEAVQSTSKGSDVPHGASAKNQGTKLTTRAKEQRNQIECTNCGGPHKMFQCSKFISLSIEARRDRCRELSVCFNCFKQTHSASSRDCNSGPCRSCPGKRHNSLLCKRSKRANLLPPDIRIQIEVHKEIILSPRVRRNLIP